MATLDETSPADGRARVRAENSIRPAAARRKAPPRPAEGAPAAARAASKSQAADSIPEEVRKRFIQVRNKYYFPDGVRAFTDRGTRLTTPSENTEVVRSLIAIARARDWREITAHGSERFRKEAWFAGRPVGLEVRGYRPTEVEQAHLIRTLARQHAAAAEEGTNGVQDSPRRGADPEPAPAERPKGLLTGKLIDHGRATYQHDPRAPMSYFVKLETARGDRVIWGIDLERAIKESLTKPQAGNEVGVRSVRQDAVKVKATERDAAGRIIGERDLDTHRNRWIIEKRDFFESRAEAARIIRDARVDPKQSVKKHPELAGTYLQVHAAELAAKRIRDPQDRERFVQTVRSALADAIGRGEPLPAVRLRERAAERRPRARERDSARARG